MSNPANKCGNNKRGQNCGTCREQVGSIGSIAKRHQLCHVRQKHIGWIARRMWDAEDCGSSGEFGTVGAIVCPCNTRGKCPPIEQNQGACEHHSQANIKGVEYPEAPWSDLTEPYHA